MGRYIVQMKPTAADGRRGQWPTGPDTKYQAGSPVGDDSVGPDNGFDHAWSTISPHDPVRGLPEAGKRISTTMLILGAVLLWVLPVAGALFLAAAGFGFAICWESEMAAMPAPTGAASGVVSSERARPHMTSEVPTTEGRC